MKKSKRKLIFFQVFANYIKNLINNIFVGVALLIHVMIFLFSKYLDLKHKHGLEQHNFATSQQKAGSTKSKYTVSFGSALFLAMILIGALQSRYGTRNRRLFLFIPLLCTAMSLFFPLLIILANPKLKKKFYKLISRPFKMCIYSNTIVPIV